MRISDSGMKETLIKVLKKALGQEIVEVTFDTEQLRGGTVGEVTLVYGVALTMDGKKLPYKVVHKRQKKWERYADPNSWRREYDLYVANVDSMFSEVFYWPKCYDAELLEDETHIWMEYMQGISGLKLNSAMYERIAEELGHFQGRIHAHMPEELELLTNLTRTDYIKNFYMHYRSWNEVYEYIRSDDCEIPKYLCKMLIDLDDNSEQIWKNIEQLPVVFCHRDFWVENVFYKDQKIHVLDWDTAGWGYLGEDIASFIADDSDITNMVENYEKSVRAYYKGFSKYVDISSIKYHYIKEMILFMFGYRLVEGFKFAETTEKKMSKLKVLEKIYEMRDETNM